MSVPLTLAVGMNSGVPASVSLLSAALAAPIAAAFGGTTLAVTGPAAVLTVLVSQAVALHGPAALPLISLGVGLLQLLSGIANVGKLVKFVPVPVVAGFTSGVGAMISIGQLPRMVGLEPAVPGAGILAKLESFAHHLPDADPASMAVGLLALALVTFVPRLHPKAGGFAIPVAVGVSTLVSMTLAATGVASVPVVGALQLEMTIGLPSMGSIIQLVPTTLLIYIFSSVEALLCAQAIDRMRPTRYHHDPCQELIGQGVTNMMMGLCAGMPVSCVIARSSLGVQRGARSRLAAVLQGMLILGALPLIAPLVAAVPLPALAAVALYGGSRMVYSPEIRHAMRVQRTDAIPFAMTVLGMLASGWVEGIVAGVATSLVFCGANWNKPDTARLGFDQAERVRVALELYSPSRLWALDKGELIRLVLGNYQKHVDVQDAFTADGLMALSLSQECVECGGAGELFCTMSSSHAAPDDLTPQICPTCGGSGLSSPHSNLPRVWWLNGPLNFLSVFRVDALIAEVREMCRGRERVIFDLHGCHFVDFTGAEALLDGLHILREEGIKVTLMNAPREFQDALTGYATFAQFDVYRQFVPGMRPSRRSSMQEAELPFPE